MTTQALTLDLLTQAVAGDAVALRRRIKLQPAGGPSDKVFPPTYEGGQYAFEDRMIDGQRLPCVLLDSVQSQANRIELALLAAHRAGKIQVPLVEVVFSGDLQEVGTLTSLEVPHRLADAILRDSELDGKKFRETQQGRTLDTASMAHATDLFGICPTALLLGLWDSTGPRGGLGAKFQRALVSEIVGVGAVMGAKTASRIDPLGIQLNAGPLYRTPDGGITLEPDQALKKEGKPILYARNSKGEDIPFVSTGKKEVPDEGRPSKANHGNVTPTIAQQAGGVTIQYAMQTVVISLPALRRLRFPIDGATNDLHEVAARTVLAALGLCGAALSISQGCDLRSRCLLIPEPGQDAWELIASDGTATAFALTAEAACQLLNAAVARATSAGLPWSKDPLRLTPSAGLAALVRKSRELAMQAGAEGT